jgi:hypothetical protein
MAGVKIQIYTFRNAEGGGSSRNPPVKSRRTGCQISRRPLKTAQEIRLLCSIAVYFRCES